MHKGLAFKRRAPEVTDPERRETEAHFAASADKSAAVIQEIHAIVFDNVQENPQAPYAVLQHNFDPEVSGQVARNGPQQVNVSESEPRTAASGTGGQAAELLWDNKWSEVHCKFFGFVPALGVRVSQPQVSELYSELDNNNIQVHN